MYLSLQKGHPVTLDKVETIAGGLAPPFAGAYTYEHVKKYVDQVVLVSDEQIKKAMKVLFKDCKLVVEPSGAAPLAAIMNYEKLGGLAVKGAKICLGLCGGNISVSDLQKHIESV